MTRFRKLFSIHSATACARQLALGDFLGEHTWQLNLRAGTVDFGKGRIYPIQLIGSESDVYGTWLWGWANQQSKLPPRILKSVKLVRKYGRRNKISELTEPVHQLSLVDGHTLAMISVGIVGNCCYYRGPREGGATFFLVMDLPERIFEPDTPQRLLTVMNQVLAQLTVHHRTMIENFLRSQRFAIRQTDTTLTAKRADGFLIKASFDKQGRMKKFNSALSR
ncbi:MAG: DUF6882 domain-containing protein [Ardenticatenaceae bacterium]